MMTIIKYICTTDKRIYYVTDDAITATRLYRKLWKKGYYRLAMDDVPPAIWEGCIKDYQILAQSKGTEWCSKVAVSLALLYNAVGVIVNPDAHTVNILSRAYKDMLIESNRLIRIYDNAFKKYDKEWGYVGL